WNPDGTLRRVLPALSSQKGVPRFAGVSDDATLLACGGLEGVDVIDLADGRRRLSIVESGVYHVAFAPTGDRLLTVSSSSGVTLWDARSGRREENWRLIPTNAGAIAFSHDGRRLAIGTKNGRAILLDAEAGAILDEIGPDAAAVDEIVWSPDDS